MDTAIEKVTLALSNRCRGSIWGQFVGDALCLGSHWIYNLDEMEQRFPGGVAGFELPAPDHYHAGKASGAFTHYGDAALLLLQSLASTGHFSHLDFGARFVALFSSEDYRGYRDHATKGTLEDYRLFRERHQESPYPFQGGAADDQPATATRLAPVVVAHYLDGDLLKVVERATRVTQNHERTLAYMRCHALVLKELLSGGDLEDAFKTAVVALSEEGEFGRELSEMAERVFGLLDQEVREATLGLGQACPLQQSFPAAMHAALKHENDPPRALLACANAGGDNAGRCAMMGAWLGALHGIEAFPAAWRDQLAAKEEIDRCVEKIVNGVGVCKGDCKGD